jgi:hypothetical protein
LQVIVKPELGGAIDFETLLLPEGLSDEERAVVSDAEGDEVLDEGVLGEDGPGERGDRGDGGSGEWRGGRLSGERRGEQRKGGEWEHGGSGKRRWDLESIHRLPGRKLLGLDLCRGIPWLSFINISAGNLDL